MFIIFESKPSISPHTPLAINLNTVHEISIRQDRDGLFVLVVDQSVSGDDREYRTIGIFKTREDAIECFENLIEAYKQGDRVWVAPS